MLDFGDPEYPNAQPGGRGKVQNHLRRMDDYFKRAPLKAVWTVLLIHRLQGDGSNCFSLLPRDVLLIILKMVWYSRDEHPLWDRACDALEPSKKVERKGNSNKRIHRKKEKKPGTGIKGFMMMK